MYTFTQSDESSNLFDLPPINLSEQQNKKLEVLVNHLTDAGFEASPDNIDCLGDSFYFDDVEYMVITSEEVSDITHNPINREIYRAFKKGCATLGRYHVFKLSIIH